MVQRPVRDTEITMAWWSLCLNRSEISRLVFHSILSPLSRGLGLAPQGPPLRERERASVGPAASSRHRNHHGMVVTVSHSELSLQDCTGLSSPTVGGSVAMEGDARDLDSEGRHRSSSWDGHGANRTDPAAARRAHRRCQAAGFQVGGPGFDGWSMGVRP
jgi:hypothetical protein